MSAPDIEAVLTAYRNAAGWRDTAQLLADDALYAICVYVLEGRLSVRAAARATGMSKTSMARVVERVREHKPLAELTPLMRPEMYNALHLSVWGAEGAAPFTRTDTDGGPTVVWTPS